MLSDSEFNLWCSKLNLSNEAKEIIKDIRLSEPSRRTQSFKNTSGRYPSKKMGKAIQFESHRLELAAIYKMEYDDNVLEYYDQPPSIKLKYISKSGKNVGIYYTPDFFVIRKDFACWEEWKPEKELKKLSLSLPNRYVQEENRGWRCIPGEEYAEELGLKFCVKTDKNIEWVYQRNIQFLEDYLRLDNLQISNSEEIVNMVKSKPGISLDELLKECKHKATVDDIYTFIAHDIIFVDLSDCSIVDTSKVNIYDNRETYNSFKVIYSEESCLKNHNYFNLETGKTISWDGNKWKIVNVGNSKITLLSEEDARIVELEEKIIKELLNKEYITGIEETDDYNKYIQEVILKASPENLKEANYRYNAILPYLNGEKPTNNTVPIRTIRDWKKKYLTAQEDFGKGFIGLISTHHRKGNTLSKLPKKTEELIDIFIKTDYETIKQKSIFEVYGALLLKCEELKIIPPSYLTFLNKIKKRNKYEQEIKRRGHRAAYQYEEFYWELELTTPRHGDRPFEICHLDHTKLDIELVCSISRQNLGRPWVTFLVDAFSRRIISIYLTFDSPSYRSCMMVVRECVMRYSRIPQIIVVDGGKEFNSVYFETLLANFHCIKKSRPPAKPRFGSVVERLFGTTNSQFIHNLLGNTKIMRDVRQVTKNVNPKNHAVWTMSSFYEMLCEWAYDIYDNKDHPAIGMSPRKKFDEGIMLYGKRKLIPYNKNFTILTLPTTRKGTAKVHSSRGIKINYIWYWSNAFREPEIMGEQVPVRYDPFNVGIAYAYVKKQWVQCISECYTFFKERSEKEIKIASAELVKRNKNHNKNYLNITAKKIAQFIEFAESKELILQSLKDAETRKALKLLQGGKDKEMDLQESSNHILQEEDKCNSNTQEVSIDELTVYEELK